MALANILHPSYAVFKNVVGTSWTKVFYLQDDNLAPGAYHAYCVVSNVGHICDISAAEDISDFSANRAASNSHQVTSEDDGLTLANKSPIIVSGLL